MAGRGRSGGLRFAGLVVAVLMGALLTLGWLIYAGREPAGVNIRMAAADGAGPGAPEPQSLPSVPLPSGPAG